MFEFFKEFFETPTETKYRNSDEMRDRIFNGWKKKDANYLDVYKKEMQRLSTLQSDIVNPPWYMPKKGKYREKKIGLLRHMRDEIKKYYVTNIDNQLNEADMFIKKMDYEPDTNLTGGVEVDEYKGKQTKTGFLRQAAMIHREQGMQGIRDLLQKEILQPVGEPDNKSVFYNYEVMDRAIKQMKANKEKKDREFDNERFKAVHEKNFLADIHQKVSVLFYKPFVADDILTGKVKDESVKEEIEKASSDITLIMNIDTNTKNDKNTLRKFAEKLQLTTVENSIFGDILRDDEDVEQNGLNFLLKNKNYCPLLKDVVLYKAYVKLDRAVVKIAEKEGMSALNLKEYARLNVIEKSFSRALSEYGILKDKMKQEFKKYKTVA